MKTAIELPDENIIKLACTGDQGAMECIYRAYAPRIFTLMNRMVRRRDIAQELMQESFVDVLKNLKSYRGDASFYAWLRRIAVNRCLMHFRKHGNKESSLDYSNEPGFEDNTEASLDLAKTLQCLTPKRRMLVWLHEVEGMTHKEIAKLMGKSESFSKTELSRAMQQLRERNKPPQDEKKTLGEAETKQIRDRKIVNKTIQTKNDQISEVGLCTPQLNNS
ncbi:MAG: RNA polymerase sigma factor [Gammaproteobacteria bacterium]|nr:RNA polymerase sigma factor [Gammaproteobacteria bacterium]